MSKLSLLAALVPLGIALTACSPTAADNSADQLDNAAAQSDPAAAAVLANEADRIREEDGIEPNGAAQEALQRAGNAQAADNAQ